MKYSSLKHPAVLILLGASLAAAQPSAEYRSDFTVQATGNFTRDVTKAGLRQSSTSQAGVLGSYRLFLHPRHGIEVNYGYAQTTWRYQLGGAEARVRTDAHEYTAAYVWRLPGRRITPFALAGAGALVFSPHGTQNSNARAEFVYGAGVDVDLTDRVFLRASYRGQVFQTPRFGASIVSPSSEITHRAQPAVGFGFRF